MQRMLMRTQKGKFYLGLLVTAGLCLILSPFLPWSYYDLYLSGGATSQVSVFTTGLGSFFSSPEVGGVSFSFPALQDWSYGTLAQVIGLLTILVSLLVAYRPEDGGLIAFLLGFINISPSLFFLGRAPEIGYTVGTFVAALNKVGYTLASYADGYAIGFLIDIIGTILLPLSAILITSNATRLRTVRTKVKTELPEKEQRFE
jgi:hypothetical protein